MAKKKILIIGNDPAMYQSIQHAIQEFHLDMFYTEGALEHQSRVVKNGYCLIIIDLSEWIETQIDLLATVRSIYYAPILALVENLNPKKQIELLGAGAEVCLGKPIAIDVCVAQALALIRFYRNAKNGDRGSLVFGRGFTISPCQRKVFIDNKPVALTKKEFDMLLFFARNPKQVFSAEQLYENIWNENFAACGMDTVKSHIR